MIDEQEQRTHHSKSLCDGLLPGLLVLETCQIPGFILSEFDNNCHKEYDMRESLPWLTQQSTRVVPSPIRTSSELQRTFCSEKGVTSCTFREGRIVPEDDDAGIAFNIAFGK
mmetsp:Transcript_28610/g.66530  ORF Transcript_28610/g.66530 Transcript_28610/m.66530 type:complete len:112 (-) Transcript_28610:4-339(-)